ncbi:hypothetical protein [Streptomyces syringium]|uniref:hypothetical protein n=1 Tax=Streptomyces syringium TaxID=76729 RepID=UPI0037D8A4FC
MTQPNPYITNPLPGRPRMFNSKIAQVIWTAVPVATLGLAAAVPFVVAAVKGVIKPWLAATYIIGEISIFAIALAISPGSENEPAAGLLLVLLMITAATHTALLDTHKTPSAK